MYLETIFVTCVLWCVQVIWTWWTSKWSLQKSETIILVSVGINWYGAKCLKQNHHNSIKTNYHNVYCVLCGYTGLWYKLCWLLTTYCMLYRVMVKHCWLLTAYCRRLLCEDHPGQDACRCQLCYPQSLNPTSSTFGLWGNRSYISTDGWLWMIISLKKKKTSVRFLVERGNGCKIPFRFKLTHTMLFLFCNDIPRKIFNEIIHNICTYWYP